MNNHKVVEEVVNKIKSWIDKQIYEFEPDKNHPISHDKKTYKIFNSSGSVFSIDHDLRILDVTSDMNPSDIMMMLYLDNNLPSGITYHLSYHGIPKGTFQYDSEAGMVHYTPIDPVEYVHLEFTIPTSGND